MLQLLEDVQSSSAFQLKTNMYLSQVTVWLSVTKTFVRCTYIDYPISYYCVNIETGMEKTEQICITKLYNTDQELVGLFSKIVIKSTTENNT